jgi:acyl carrier protein
MGLDTVELVVEFEKTFNIHIPNAEAAEIVTVKDATDTILRHMQLQLTDSSRTKKLFYQFRRYFEDKLEVDRTRFLPSTALDDVFPMENREARWLHMEQDLGWKLARCEDLALIHEPFPAVKFLGITWKQQQERDQVRPMHQYTIKELIDYVLALNYSKLINLQSAISRYDVEKIVIVITSDKSGVPIHEIRPESSFTNDLGMD